MFKLFFNNFKPSDMFIVFRMMIFSPLLVKKSIFSQFFTNFSENSSYFHRNIFILVEKVILYYKTDNSCTLTNFFNEIFKKLSLFIEEKWWFGLHWNGIFSLRLDLPELIIWYLKYVILMMNWAKFWVGNHREWEVLAPNSQKIQFWH